MYQNSIGTSIHFWKFAHLSQIFYRKMKKYEKNKSAHHTSYLKVFGYKNKDFFVQPNILSFLW